MTNNNNNNNNVSFLGHEPEDQKKIIHQVSLRDKKQEVKLVEHLDYLHNLNYITREMKSILLKTVDLEVIAIALRVATKDLILTFTQDLTGNIMHDFLYFLNKPQRISSVLNAQVELIQTMRRLENKGLIYFSPEAFKVYV